MATGNHSIGVAELASGEVMTWTGAVRVVAGPQGVRSAEIPHWTSTHDVPNEPTMTIFEAGDADALRHLRQALTELDEYFRGARRDFTVTLDPQGTAFYQTAWAEVARVPFGETRSYGEIARAIGASAAVRAVGAANGANPVAPFVPCHRIVGSDGRLTGYGPGLPLKALLLAMEGAIPADADHYDGWATTLSDHNHGDAPVLGIRGAAYYCAPGCARSRARWFLPPRLFADAVEAEEAGYTPCPACHGLASI